MIPTTRTPEYVWDMLYSNDSRGKVLKAVEFYYQHIYAKNHSQQLIKALVFTWVRTYGIRTVRKAKAIIINL